MSDSFLMQQWYNIYLRMRLQIFTNSIFIQH